MKVLLAEQPVIVTIMLGVVGLGLLYGWLQSGKRIAAALGLVAFAMIPVAWVVAERWVTDREQIREAILQTADAVERNDHQTAVSIIADDQYRKRALTELPRFDFNEARVTGERSISVQPDAYPPSAEVDLMVRVEVTGRGGGTGTIKAPQRLLLNFEKLGGDWKVVRYQHLPIVGGSNNASNLVRP